jgi:hypothetical protein
MWTYLFSESTAFPLRSDTLVFSVTQSNETEFADIIRAASQCFGQQSMTGEVIQISLDLASLVQSSISVASRRIGF